MVRTSDLATVDAVLNICCRVLLERVSCIRRDNPVRTDTKTVTLYIVGFRKRDLHVYNSKSGSPRTVGWLATQG